MHTSEATIATPRAARYLTQFGNHARAMAGTRGHSMPMHGTNPLAGGEVNLNVESTADHVMLTFNPWGRATLRLRDNTLTLTAEATDRPNLDRIQEILTRDIERFGRRDQLVVTWQTTNPAPDPNAAPGSAGRADSPQHGARPTTATPHRPTRPTLILITGVLGLALVIAAHLGIGGAALAAWSWLGWTAVVGAASTAAILIIGHAAVPVAALGLRRHASRRRRR